VSKIEIVPSLRTDGSINLATVPLAVESGAELLIAGEAVFNGDAAKNIKSLYARVSFEESRMKTRPLIILGSDHAGFRIKEFIKNLLSKENCLIKDVGTFSPDPVDYPEYAERVAVEVKKGKNRKGILTCGTGIGASIAANKIPGIRAALVCNTKDARLSIEHNNANILVLGGRPFNKVMTKRMIGVWFRSEFQGGRHQRRLNEISRLEKKYLKA
jgi:ribose 5-phosphate isomerase B